MSFYLQLNTNENIVYGFHSRKKILWKSMVPIILQNIFLCIQHKKETHTGLQQLEGE